MDYRKTERKIIAQKAVGASLIKEAMRLCVCGCDRDRVCVYVCVCVCARVHAPSGPIATGSGSRVQRGVKGWSLLPVPIRLMAGDLLAFILMTAVGSKARPG